MCYLWDQRDCLCSTCLWAHCLCVCLTDCLTVFLFPEKEGEMTRHLDWRVERMAVFCFLSLCLCVVRFNFSESDTFPHPSCCTWIGFSSRIRSFPQTSYVDMHFLLPQSLTLSKSACSRCHDKVVHLLLDLCHSPLLHHYAIFGTAEACICHRQFIVVLVIDTPVHMHVCETDNNSLMPRWRDAFKYACSAYLMF